MQNSGLSGSGRFFPSCTLGFAFEDSLGSDDAVAECPAIGIEFTPDRIPLACVGSHSTFVERLDVAFELSNRNCELSLKLVRVESHFGNTPVCMTAGELSDERRQSDCSYALKTSGAF